MKRILVHNILFVLCCSCLAQSQELNQLANRYQNDIKLPAVASELDNSIVVDKVLLNDLIFDKQEEKAKFYANNGKLVNVTTYGKIDEEPFDYETWEKVDGSVKWFNKSFDTEAYSLGCIIMDKNFRVWVTKVVGFQKTYIDLYVFDKSGKLKSLVNLYEAEYESNGEPSKVSNVYITSTLKADGTIIWKEDRFSVKTIREYRLQPDGYFKVIKQESVGEYEP